MSLGKELQNKGLQQFQQKKYEGAANTFREAIEAFAQEEDAQSVAEMHVNLGLCLRNMEQYEESIEETQKGLAYFKEHELLKHEAQALGNIALAYAELGDTEQAETFYRTSAQMFLELKENDLYGETMLAIGDMYFKQRNFMMATGAFEQGLVYIKDKSRRQKLMKQLLVAKNMATGVGNIDAPPDEEGDASTDSRRRRKNRGLGLLRRNTDGDEAEE